ncbi:MAG: EAL domain-containing protein [Chromatiales bacterium]|nr:EAL domain-containing protein [Chromatiales bacterium]
MQRFNDPTLLSIAVENTRDGIVVTDAENRIVFVNKAFIDVTGYSPEDVLGQNPGMLKSGRQSDAFYDKMWRTIYRRGFWQGEIWDRHKNGESHLKWLTITAVRAANNAISHYVGVFTDYRAPKQKRSRFTSIGNLDILTQLPNRTQLSLHLNKFTDQAARDKKLLVVSVLDLDDFKTINDRHGHRFGDQVLVKLAERLRNFLTADDTICRLGGDEFLVILDNLLSIDELEQQANLVLETITKPIEIEGKICQISACMGITIFPFDNADPETLLRHADQAMYKAKEKGTNTFHLFDTIQDHKTQTRRQLLHRLAAGLANDELVLHYQPKVNLRHGEVVGVEALLRWNHPEQGILGPALFLPHVEHHDLIIAIGEWVIDQALTQVKQWHDAGLTLPVSINVAARQLLRSDFVDTVKQCLKQHPGLPPNCLEIEILESAALENTQHVGQVIEQCRELGITFALDDFGTGYASLSYLRNIPADTLKIDRTFVRDVLDNQNDLTLVEGIVGLATAFGRTVIAEGVETTEQGVLLMRLGCDIAQGFGISSAMPAERVPNWVKTYKPDPQWALWADTVWEMNDFPLLVAQYDTIRWVRRILLHAEGAKLHIGPDELSDHHHCRFGHWYYGHGTQRYGHLSEFTELERIHLSIHQVGQQIVRHMASGENARAKELATELLAHKESILDKLSKLQHQVAQSNHNNRLART